MSEIQSTQDKYRRAQKSNEPPQIEENEVRITTRGRVKKYVDYATRLFQGGFEHHDEQKEQTTETPQDGSEENPTTTATTTTNTRSRGPSKQFDTIVLKATGKAINKAVTTAEIVKRTIGDLHQETGLETLEIVDVWEPKEEGLQKVETTRRVASISIKLSRKLTDVNEEAPGYQKPIAQETGFMIGNRRGRGGNGGGGFYRNNYNNNRGGGGWRGNRNNRGFDNRRRRPQNNNRNNNNNNNGYRGGGGGGGGQRRGGGGYNNYYRGQQGGPPGQFNNQGGYNNQGGGGYRGGGGRRGGNGGGYGNRGGFGSPNRRYPRNDGRRGGRGGQRRPGPGYY